VNKRSLTVWSFAVLCLGVLSLAPGRDGAMAQEGPAIYQVPETAPAADARTARDAVQQLLTPAAPPATPSVPAQQTAPAPAQAAPAAKPEDRPAPSANFAAQDAVIDLRPYLSAQRVSDPADPGTVWFMLPVRNQGTVPSSRILVAAENPSAGLALAPLNTRPLLKEGAASDPSVVLERAYAFGGNAFRVLLPPIHSATLALHFEGANARPGVVAWTESALIAHNHRAAILSGLVAGLFIAALAYAGGTAVLTGAALAQWAAFLVAGLLFANLAAAGVFDRSWMTAMGGPYGLFAFALALALAAGVRLLDHIVPYETVRAGLGVWRDRVALGFLVLGIAAFLGVPVTGLLVRIIAVIAAAGAAGYLAHYGRLGMENARRFAPAATIFALVTAAGTFDALGLFEGNLIAHTAIAGFSAAGATLLVLASCAGLGHGPGAVLALLPASAKKHSDTPEPNLPREQAAVAASHQGVFDLDLETGHLSLSSEAASIFGLPEGAVEISRDDWLERIHAEDREVYQQALETYRNSPGLAFRLEFRARGSTGGTSWFELRATMTGQATEAERCLGLIADVTARKLAEPEALLPHVDGLTGLGNRLALFERLQSAGPGFARLALVVFDLDRFKSVNFSLGQDGADTVLRGVAARLNEHFERPAASYRLGGDTFAVLAVVDNAGAESLGSAVLNTMQTAFVVKGRDVFLPASVGVAAARDAQDVQDLIEQAELAMVQAKREGGSRLCVYSREMGDGAAQLPVRPDSVALDTDLRRALERGEIEIHYQPIMRMSDGSIAGFEALARWRHPERGLIDPENFIPHAEESGLIIPLGRLALRRAAEDLARWQQYFAMTPPLFVSVNVAWRQIADPDFAKELATLLRNAGLAERTLKLEVTESAVMADAAGAEKALKRLRALGAGLAIDDFGTGHSSLSHLRRFPFEVIKIDKSFLKPSSEEQGSKILESMVSLAHELGLAVVMEGVEREEDAKRLRAMGCEYAQGYLFGAPIPGGDAAGFIAMTYAR